MKKLKLKMEPYVDFLFIIPKPVLITFMTIKKLNQKKNNYFY